MAEGDVRHIRSEQVDGVGILTLDRAERFNAMDAETARDFRAAALRLARDEAVRAVVVRGREGVFCTGADLKYVREGGADQDRAYLRPSGRAEAPGFGAAFQQILEYLHSAIAEIRRAPKPFLASVDGVAAAGGFGIAMACDLVLASERARFEWAYGRTGLTGAESASFLLPRLVGLRGALGLVMLNPRIDARRALHMGLVNEVLPTEGFEEAVLATARRLAAGPTRAYGVAKALVNRAVGMERLDAHLDRELEELARVADGEEFAEGLAGFLEKRPARFPGDVRGGSGGR
jgi:2-(1,2-epoxy-1,2-dihydrophenyl)acetyl-CoA isomerase